MGWRARLGTSVAGVVGAGGLLASPAAAGTTGTITVTPATGLHDLQLVDVQLVGPPNVGMIVMQCRNPITSVLSDCGGAFGVSTETGTYSTKLYVHRAFESQNATDVECISASPCALTLWLAPPGATFPTLADIAPISFSK